MMYYLYHIMGAYPVWAAETLKNTIQKPRDKKKIEKALRSYIPMIVGLGYQPVLIYRYCKQFFKDHEICDEACLERFIKHFDGSDIEYTVYFAVDKRVLKFKTILESRLGISFEKDEFSEKLRFDHSKYICMNMHCGALDPNGAAIRAYNAFGIFMRFYKFLGNRDEDWCWDTALVKDPNGMVEFPPLKPDHYAVSKDYDETENGKLYISYPMIEALYDYKADYCDSFFSCYVDVKNLVKYKNLVGKDNRNASKHFIYGDWEDVLNVFGLRVRCLFDNLDMDYRYYLHNVTPSDIYDRQWTIRSVQGMIFVLSALPEFLFDYFKEGGWKKYTRRKNYNYETCIINTVR